MDDRLDHITSAASTGRFLIDNYYEINNIRQIT
jgi:hypothetical protein